MLLDRRRIRKWAKWVALVLAVVFGAGTIFMGVGYGTDVNLLAACGGEKQHQATTPEDKLAAFEQRLEENPTDVDALLGAAGLYQQDRNYGKAITYLERVLGLQPDHKEIYVRLANLYLSSDVSDYGAAVSILNKATSIDPNNPEVYLKLGTAQSHLGNTEAAILAWQKYLQLDPNGEMAAVVKEQIEKMSNKPSTPESEADGDTGTSGSSETTEPAAP